MKNRYSKLFETGYIGKLKIKNRLVMLPMGTVFALVSGEVSQDTIDYFAERAKGGVGLITIGYVSPIGLGGFNCLSLDSPKFLQGHYELVEAIHSNGDGVKVALQLCLAGREQYPETLEKGEPAISSSPLGTFRLDKVYPPARALERDEIFKVIDRFAEAAARGKRVGYDTIELHGAHGYLIEQFMSPYMNKRKDDFGGSLENRMRFPLELIKRVREAVGPDYPVGFRISVDEFVEGGLTLKETTVITRMLQEAGMAYINATGGFFETITKMVDVMRYPEGWKLYLWHGIKKAVSIPVIAGGGLRTPAYCEKLLREGKVDFIGLARPFLADPEWPNKVREGREEDICPCISCLECLDGSARRRWGGGARRCTVNPAYGREREFSRIIPAEKKKRVMVIGGGPGGLEAARVAALRGHEVLLYEKERQLGGQLLLAVKPQSKQRMKWFLDYLSVQMSKLGVTVKLGSKVTPRLVAQVKPDAVVVATGAGPIIPDFLRAGTSAVTAWDILNENVKPKGKEVVIIGGGLVGCEIADYLLELANRVTIVEQLPSIAADMQPANRADLLEHLKEGKVAMLERHKAVAIKGKAVQVMASDTSAEETLKADLVVIAVGTKSEGRLAEQLEGKVAELHVIGDCLEPRCVMEAVYEGSLAGRKT